MGLPTGPAVTFLFTDIEGSTRLERQVGAAAWATIVARHDELLRSAIEAAGGVVVKTEGDAFFAAFERPMAGAGAAVAAQRAVAADPWPEGVLPQVRMGLHIGEGRLRHGQASGDPEDYVGIDVNYTARIAAAGNGGQIVVSEAMFAALGPALSELTGTLRASLADEGLRAVKDFEEPARLHRLIVPGAAEDTRPLRTLETPSNLPGEVTALVGREAQIALIQDALAEHRIVTLTGAGGSGKTRLALAVARSVVDRFPHGVWFVDLAALSESERLGSTIAATLGVKDSTELTVADALWAHLRDRTVLLVLDNLEQLLPGGADTVARLVRDAPGLRVVVTSRELLRIAGERGHPVPPLDVEAGVALFEDRARALRADLVVSEADSLAIRAICERLGGLPLAIELAAGRIRLLTPTQILERLGRSLDLAGGARDLPERQRTLRGAIAWSHDLLSIPERRLFRRLGVFAGGWSMENAEAVADAGSDLGIELAEGLGSLADKSLIRLEPVPAGAARDDAVRFGQVPLLRDYALERLEESGERPTIEARHAEVTAASSEAAGQTILGATSEATMRRLDREDANLQAALAWALANDRPEIGLRIMGATWRWFQQRGRLRESRALLAQLLEQSASVDDRLRILALTASGGLAYWMDDPAGAATAYEERLALAQAIGDPKLTADAHYDLGFVSMVANEGERLREHEHRALEIYTAAGLTDDANRARQGLALAVFLAGDYTAARRLIEQNLEAFRASGSTSEVADSTMVLSAVHYRLGDPVAGWRGVMESLAFYAASDSAAGMARGLALASIILFEYGDPRFAARIAGTTFELARQKGVMLGPVRVLHLPDPGELAVDRLGAESARALLADGAATPLASMIDEVLTAPPPAADRG